MGGGGNKVIDTTCVVRVYVYAYACIYMYRTCLTKQLTTPIHSATQSGQLAALTTRWSDRCDNWYSICNLTHIITLRYRARHNNSWFCWWCARWACYDIASLKSRVKSIATTYRRLVAIEHSDVVICAFTRG